MNKKINLIWLFSLLMMVQVGFVSCNKDDDDDAVSTADLKTSIIGVWKEMSEVWYIDGKEVDDTEYEYSDDDYTVEEFKSDGTYVESEYINGKVDTSEEYHGTWKLEGDMLTQDGDYTVQVTIKGNTLKTTEEWSDTGNDNKVHTIKVVCTFIKQ